MARSQADYLKGILEDDEDPVPLQEHGSGRQRGTTLLGRESALARVASGEVRQVTQMLLDPKRVRPWKGNARVYDQLTETSCRELIESIIAEGGQKVPAVVRRLSGDADHDFEVIAGTRRHWSVSWLRAHSYPDIKFVAQVAEMDDEAAFRLADLENRAREDVTVLERARNYREALEDHYGGHQTRMAERLRLSQGWLSKMLKVATIPDRIIAAFASPAEVTLKPAYSLAQALADEERVRAIETEGDKIAHEQAACREAGEVGIAAGDVLKRLLTASSSPDENTRTGGEPLVFNSRFDRPALSVLATNRQGATIRLHAGSGANSDELQKALKTAIDQLHRDGRWTI